MLSDGYHQAGPSGTLCFVAMKCYKFGKSLVQPLEISQVTTWLSFTQTKIYTGKAEQKLEEKNKLY